MKFSAFELIVLRDAKGHRLVLCEVFGENTME